ncbi:uncharacterized protein YecT (DUF1311 family) [Amorphus suaedae]
MLASRPAPPFPLARLAALAAFAVLATWPLAPAAAQQEIDADLAACENDPRFRVGGAAIGECLEMRRAVLDRQIGDLAESQARRFCASSDQADVRAAQQDWLSYRAAHCGLITRSPGNTVSYVSGTVCNLILARQRMAGLKLMQLYARPLCPAFELVNEASRPGEQTDEPVEIPRADLEWVVAGGLGEEVLVVRETTGRQRVLSETDLSGCYFCSGEEDNCAADGVYVMADPEIPTRPRVFAVCHSGAHSQSLRLVDPVASGSDVAFAAVGSYFLEWKVEKGTLRVFLDGETRPSQIYPPEPN